MKQITVISGVLVAMTGIWCFARPGEPFINLAFLFGAAMLLSGISNIFTWLAKHKTGQVSGYLLAEGIMSVLYSIVVLSNQLIVDAVIPVFFGMAMISTGMMRIMAAFRWHRLQDPHWQWFFGFGLATVLMGCAGFLPSVVTSFSIIALLGICFLLQGINMIVIGIHMRHRIGKEEVEALTATTQEEMKE
ncbi:MAG: DUF308 domain-containing protein [Firmicutes bacterium]|nr:DUF308 domain-containing protein [Bacillota bacterium]MBQ2271709.1 DUF308 domain-containing protein [Bacillota bacterium]MBQ5796973.1 DUF308 domain-containing protein [Bacillota bacterium]